MLSQEVLWAESFKLSDCQTCVKEVILDNMKKHFSLSRSLQSKQEKEIKNDGPKLSIPVCPFLKILNGSSPPTQNRVQVLMRVSPIPWLPSWFFSALAVNPDTDTSLRLPLLCGPSSFVFVHACMLCVCAQSCLTGTPWTAALQAPLSMEFSRPESWSGQRFPSPESAIVCLFPPPFQTPVPLGSPQSTEQSSLRYTVGSHQLSTLYVVTIVCICQSQSPNSPPFPIWHPYVCSLHLYLCFCFAHRFICTIFLDSTCMC